MKLGRYCALNGEKEESGLEYGMDFRLPRYRREVFLRFYQFHLKYRSHPGCVYYLFPYLRQVRGWTMEQALWFAFINGNTQNPVTSWIIFRDFPDVHALNEATLRTWFEKEYQRLAFDTDRRYFRKKFIECVLNYRKLLAGRSQEEFFSRLAPSADGGANFRSLWVALNRLYIYFGRLSVFSYLEYLRIFGINVECDQLFLDDMAGSKSHRNGICKVLGRDDLDWHESNPGFGGDYGARGIAWLAEEAAQLLVEARQRMGGEEYARDIGYFTLESTLCTYKSWHRPNRRYANVYNDMLVNRIRAAGETWGEKFDLFWDARRTQLPANLRLEDNPADCGLAARKQNHYRETGQTVMMDQDWPCFRNDFNDAIYRAQEKAA